MSNRPILGQKKKDVGEMVLAAAILPNLTSSNPEEEKKKSTKKRKKPTKKEKVEPEPTEEQKLIFNSNFSFKPNHLMVIEAMAGTGKTWTIGQIIKRTKKIRFLYSVFNKQMSDDAKKAFKPYANCTAFTYHGLGYRYIVTGLDYKLFIGGPGGRFRFYTDVIRDFMHKAGTLEGFAEFHNFKNKKAWDEAKHMWDFRCLWNHTMWSLNSFCLSSSTVVEARHASELNDLMKTRKQALDPNSDLSNTKRKKILRVTVPELEDVLKLANYIVKCIVAGELKTINQNFSFKLLHLLKVDFSKDFDCFALDEVQDSMPVMREIIGHQKNMAWIAVGDPLQAINAWLKAENSIPKLRAMIPLENQMTFYLTESFRFGPEVAQLVNRLFAQCRYKLEKPMQAKVRSRTEIVSIEDEKGGEDVARFMMENLFDYRPVKGKKKSEIKVLGRNKADILSFISGWMKEVSVRRMDMHDFNFKCSTAIKSDLDEMIKYGKLSEAELNKQIDSIENQLFMAPDDEELKGKFKMLNYISMREDRIAFCHKLYSLIHPRLAGKNMVEMPDEVSSGEDEEDEEKSEEENSSNSQEERDREEEFMKFVRERTGEDGPPAKPKPKAVAIAMPAPAPPKTTTAKPPSKQPVVKPDYLTFKVDLHVMTIHASKGLEGDYVFVIGGEKDIAKLDERVAQVENGTKHLIIYQHALYLLYVAITRAKHFLCIPRALANLIELGSFEKQETALEIAKKLATIEVF